MTNVTITTVVDLTAAQLTQIKKAIEKKYGSDVEYTAVVDSKILGGVQITIGSRQLDGSLINKFDQLRRKLSK
jgi:F-type H+-transporting ATPase subunit delta